MNATDFEGLRRERDELAAILSDLSIDDSTNYGRGHNDGWQEGIEAAARLAAGQSTLDSAIWGPSTRLMAAIRALRPPVPHCPTTREAELRKLLARCREVIAQRPIERSVFRTEDILADIDAALASQE